MYKWTGPVNKETQDDFARRSNLSCVRRHKIQTASAQATFAEAEKPAAASAAAPPDVTMMLALQASTAQSRQDDRRCHQDDARRLDPRRASFACIVTGGPALLARDAFKACSNGVRGRVAAPFASLRACSSNAMIEQIGDFQKRRTTDRCRLARNAAFVAQPAKCGSELAGFFYRPTIFALSAATSRRGVGPDPALTGWS